MRNLIKKNINLEKRRYYGEHLTSIEIFKKFILPYIKEKLYRHTWVDLYAGEGNLILPILNYIDKKERIEFFTNRIYLFDIQEEKVKKSVCNAISYGIPEAVAVKNIIKRDTLKNYPDFINNKDYPVLHITNPPYLYIGYIVKKGGRNFTYFKDENKGYQDLYQIALINDLRNGIKEMIYIIPTNFIYGDSCSNKIRNDLLKFYDIERSFIFEEKIFKYTGTNVGIFFFKKKTKHFTENIKFHCIKIKNGVSKNMIYTLKPENNYKAGDYFNEFTRIFKSKKHLSVKFYLNSKELLENKGTKKLEVIDANKFIGKNYEIKSIYVNDKLYNKILNNTLFVRTIDTGSEDGRAGLYEIKDVFNVKGIIVSKPYRTHPIQLFFEPEIGYNDQINLKKYFNLLLEYFREQEDSDFLTTFKYSESSYTRKYLGLNKTKSLIYTFPILEMSNKEKIDFYKIISKENSLDIIEFVKSFNKYRGIFNE